VNTLHLLRLQVDSAALMRFANDQRLLEHDDEGHGYVLHAWLAAMFGAQAPKPFRYFEGRQELLGYTRETGATLLEHSQAFASPLAHVALIPGSLATKPMPESWRAGQRLQAESLVCPISRKDGHEKDVYLRALDRLDGDAPSRAAVYTDWFRRQCAQVIDFEHLELVGLSRGRLLRRGRAERGRQVRSIDRPQALFRGVVTVADGQGFGELLARGIGRHRAFGFGMVLLAPAP